MNGLTLEELAERVLLDPAATERERQLATVALERVGVLRNPYTGHARTHSALPSVPPGRARHPLFRN